MSQALVQTGAEIVVSGGTSGNVTLNGVGAGNLLTASCQNQSSATPTFSISDGVNAWASAVWAGGNSKTSQILYAANVAAGNTIVTVAASVSSTWTALIEEWSGSATSSPLAATDNNAESVNATAHEASVAGINPGAASIVIVGTQCNSTMGATKTPGTGYTLDTASNAGAMREYQIFSSAPTNEHGAFTSTTNVKATAVIAAFKAAAAPAGRGQIVGGRYGGMIC